VFRLRLTSLIRLSVSSLDRFAEVRESLACLHRGISMCALCGTESKVLYGMISLGEFPKTVGIEALTLAVSLLET
jgi:hypothetical protein